MKFSIRFLGIIALSDVTQAAFVPIHTNTTGMAKATSMNTTDGPEFPIKAVPRRHRRRGLEPWANKDGLRHCADQGMWACFRERLKYQMRDLHRHSILPTSAYYSGNFVRYHAEFFCEGRPGEMSSSECTCTSADEFGWNLRELAFELGYPGLKEWGLPGWYDELQPKPIPLEDPRRRAAGEGARAKEKEVDD